MASSDQALRFAFVAGTLGMGGAEKQLVYMVRALVEAGADVRVYSLTRGEHYETELVSHGIRPVWIGRVGDPPWRLAALLRELRAFRPHIIQSAHFFTNLYVGLAAPLIGALSIGAIRSDTSRELKEHGRWSGALLGLPAALIANSHAARASAVKRGVPEDKISVLYNVIDLENFDRAAARPQTAEVAPDQVTAALVANLIPFKRVDRYLDALAAARQQTPQLDGLVIGDGRSRADLEAHAEKIGLLPDGVRFLGRREDIPALLARADFLVLTSDHEGIPNVLLEAMAAGLPVITTPTGDAALVVQDGLSGFVVDYEDHLLRVQRMLELTRSRDLRKAMGGVGRRLVENRYSFDRLRGNLLTIYAQIARRTGKYRLQEALEMPAWAAVPGSEQG